MTKIKGQIIPSEWFEWAANVFMGKRKIYPGYNYYVEQYPYTYVFQNKGPKKPSQKRGKRYPKISKAQEEARCRFTKSSQTANMQVDTGGAEWPETGPRDRKWWYDNNPAGYCYWNDYCIKETYKDVKKNRRPPWAIAPTIWICSTDNHRVEKWNGRTMELELYSEGGAMPEEKFGQVTRCAVDNIWLYVCDYSNNKIHILNKNDLSYIKYYETAGGGEYSFVNPFDIAVDDKCCYIIELNGNKLIIVDKVDFSVKDIITIRNWSDGTPPSIMALCVDHDYIYVADYYNAIVYLYGRKAHEYNRYITVLNYLDEPALSCCGIVSDGERLYCLDQWWFTGYIMDVASGALILQSEITEASEVGIGLSGDLLFVMNDLASTLYKVLKVDWTIRTSWENFGTEPGQFNMNMGVCGEEAFYWDAC